MLSLTPKIVEDMTRNKIFLEASVARIKLIETIIFKLLITEAASEIYKKPDFPAVPFSPFLQDSIKEAPTEISLSQILDYIPCLPLTKVFSLISSPEYSSPKTLQEVLAHLRVLWSYWALYVLNPQGIEGFKPTSFLDLALVKLVGQAQDFITRAELVGDRETTRIKKSTAAKSKSRNERINWIIRINAVSSKIKEGMSINARAKIIQEEFNKLKGDGTIPSQIKTPSSRTIRNILAKDS